MTGFNPHPTLLEEQRGEGKGCRKNNSCWMMHRISKTDKIVKILKCEDSTYLDKY